MKYDCCWKRKPEEGKKFIYRYYDVEGKSYIGQTKSSLFTRAGGTDGKNYTVSDSKFRDAIKLERRWSYEKKYFYCGTLSFIGFIGFMHCSIFLYAWRAGH